MKKVLPLLAIFIFANTSLAYEFDQYNLKEKPNQSSQSNNFGKVEPARTTKIYNKKGEYQGEAIERNNQARYYDNKGQYQGNSINKDDSND